MDEGVRPADEPPPQKEPDKNLPDERDGDRTRSAKSDSTGQLEHSHRGWRFAFIVAGTSVAVLIVVAVAVALFALAYHIIPVPARAFVVLGATAGSMIVGGLATLIVIIPLAAFDTHVKTEFYSARAAYYCVLSGLVLLSIVAIGAVFTSVLLSTGGR